LHGNDQSKNEGQWSYNPTWFSSEDSKGKNSTVDTPSKGLNTKPSGETSPVTNSLATTIPPVNSLPAKVPDSLPTSSIPAANLLPPPKIPPKDTPAVKSPPAPKVPPKDTPAVKLPPPPEIPPKNTPAVNSLLASSVSPVNLPPAQAAPPPSNVPEVNSPPARVSDSLPASKISPVNSPLVNSPPPVSNVPVAQPSNSPPLSNIPPEISPPAQAPGLPPVQNVPLVNSPPAQAPGLQPINSPPVPITPPAQGYFPVGPQFSSPPGGPNHNPHDQSSYNPVGPALSAQVGNKSYEMAGKFRNVSQSQTTTNTIVVQLQNMGMAAPVVSDFNLTNYLRNPTKYISAEDYDDAYRGAADTILQVTETKDFFDAITCGYLEAFSVDKCLNRLQGKEGNQDGKDKQGHKTTIAINVIRLCYFTFQFIYPIIVAIATGGPVAYNVVCSLFAFAGLLYDGIQIIWKLKKHFDDRKNDKETKELEKQGEKVMENNQQEAVESQLASMGVQTSGLVGEIVRGNTKPDDENKNPTGKKKTTIQKLLREFVQDMLEEIIIYPSLICNLYGFINERGWEFNDALSVFDFLLTFISFFMDAVFAKAKHIYLLYHLIDKTTANQRERGLYSYATPVNLFIPFSIGLAIAHTLMVGLIAVRIYADNFNNKTGSAPQKEGNYTVTSYTSYMIFCGAYLPLMSAACYIILNKHWFLQISWIMHNDTGAALDKMNFYNITNMPVRVKLFGFLRDKYAYLAVTTFAPLYIAFYNGGFLGDYDSDVLPKGAAAAAGVMGTLFVLIFNIINIQAGIIFAIIIILIMLTLCVICTGGGSSRDARNRLIR